MAVMYKFRSKDSADVIMLGATGEQILRLIGKEPAPQGIVTQAQLAGAISALEQAVAEDEATFARLQADAEAAGEPAPRRQGVTLRQRAWPLLELMRSALRGGHDLLWGG